MSSMSSSISVCIFEGPGLSHVVILLRQLVRFLLVELTIHGQVRR